MRSIKRKVSGNVKSKSKVDIVLTIEEAEQLVDCDPGMIDKLGTFLEHMGFKREELDD